MSTSENVSSFKLGNPYPSDLRQFHSLADIYKLWHLKNDQAWITVSIVLLRGSGNLWYFDGSASPSPPVFSPHHVSIYLLTFQITYRIRGITKVWKFQVPGELSFSAYVIDTLRTWQNFTILRISMSGRTWNNFCFALKRVSGQFDRPLHLFPLLYLHFSLVQLIIFQITYWVIRRTVWSHHPQGRCPHRSEQLP